MPFTPRKIFRGFLAAAHRGGGLLRSNLGRENTLHAFGEATQLGYRVLETDVRTTRDGVTVLHHDPDIRSTTEHDGLINDLTFAQLRQALVGGVDVIPTVDEALEAFPDSHFMIDLKDSRSVEPLVKQLDAHRAWGRVSVGSFSAVRLSRFRRLAPPESTTVADPVSVVGHLLRVPFGQRVLAAFQIPVEWRTSLGRIQVLTPSFIQRAHSRGIAVHVWTVNNEEQMHQVIDLGVDGIVTDALDVAKRVLQQRGLWEES